MDPLSISLYSIHAAQFRTTLGFTSLAISIIGFAEFYKGFGRENGKANAARIIVYILGITLLVSTIAYGVDVSLSFINFIEEAKKEHRVKKRGEAENKRHDGLLDTWKREGYYHLIVVAIIFCFSIPFVIFLMVKSFRSA